MLTFINATKLVYDQDACNSCYNYILKDQQTLQTLPYRNFFSEFKRANKPVNSNLLKSIQINDNSK